MTAWALRIDPRSAVDESERIEAPSEPDQSEQLRRTHVWRLDQFTSLGFDSARAALMADDAGSTSPKRAG
jgi:hypothetical protein